MRAIFQPAGFVVHSAGSGNADGAEVFQGDLMFVQQLVGQMPHVVNGIYGIWGKGRGQRDPVLQLLPDGEQMQPQLLRPQGNAEEVLIRREGKKLRPLAACVGGVSLPCGNHKAAAKEKLNGFHHGLTAKANGSRNIVGAAYAACQKGLNDLNAVSIF